jgi:folate-dependent tRNA-U54 methylase TrmFO/GidA
MALREHPDLFVAGVLAGTEGYLESSATGWLAGTNAARRVLGLPLVVPPEASMLGGLVRFLAGAEPDGFQPMNANWGLVPSHPSSAAGPASASAASRRTGRASTPSSAGSARCAARKRPRARTAATALPV